MKTLIVLLLVLCCAAGSWALGDGPFFDSQTIIVEQLLDELILATKNEDVGSAIALYLSESMKHYRTMRNSYLALLNLTEIVEDPKLRLTFCYYLKHELEENMPDQYTYFSRTAAVATQLNSKSYGLKKVAQNYKELLDQAKEYDKGLVERLSVGDLAGP